MKTEVLHTKKITKRFCQKPVRFYFEILKFLLTHYMVHARTELQCWHTELYTVACRFYNKK